MRLSNRAVYNPHKADMMADEVEGEEEPAAREVISDDIVIKDHFFDTPERRRCQQRVAKPSDVVLDGTMRGEKGVRENYKVVSSKL